MLLRNLNPHWRLRNHPPPELPRWRIALQDAASSHSAIADRIGGFVQPLFQENGDADETDERAPSGSWLAAGAVAGAVKARRKKRGKESSFLNFRLAKDVAKHDNQFSYG